MKTKMNDRVRVYFNSTRDCFSIQQYRERWVVVDYTSRILLREATFVVKEKGRQRVLTTGRKNVHAWVEGLVGGTYTSLLKPIFLPPLNIWPRKAFCLREITYNPQKHMHFVRCDQPNQPVTSSDLVLLDMRTDSVLGIEQPRIWAYRHDMWGEYTEKEAEAWEAVAENQSIFRHPPHCGPYESLCVKGLLYGIITLEGGVQGIRYCLADDVVQSRLNPEVYCIGGFTWGYWDESQTKFTSGFSTEEEAIAALKHYAARLEEGR